MRESACAIPRFVVADRMPPPENARPIRLFGNTFLARADRPSSGGWRSAMYSSSCRTDRLEVLDARSFFCVIRWPSQP